MARERKKTRDEPIYVDAPEQDIEEQEKPIPNWKFPTDNDLCRRALMATGRKYFADRQERSRWLKIERGLAPLDRSGQVIYPQEWVEMLVAWAEKKNRAYQNASLTPRVQIIFPALLGAIENEEKRTDWINAELSRRRKQTVDWQNDSLEELYGDRLPDNLRPDWEMRRRWTDGAHDD
jgi:hypothetical protein